MQRLGCCSHKPRNVDLKLEKQDWVPQGLRRECGQDPGSSSVRLMWEVWAPGLGVRRFTPRGLEPFVMEATGNEHKRRAPHQAGPGGGQVALSRAVRGQCPGYL